MMSLYNYEILNHKNFNDKGKKSNLTMEKSEKHILSHQSEYSDRINPIYLLPHMMQ